MSEKVFIHPAWLARIDKRKLRASKDYMWNMVYQFGYDVSKPEVLKAFQEKREPYIGRYPLFEQEFIPWFERLGMPEQAFNELWLFLFKKYCANAKQTIKWCRGGVSRLKAVSKSTQPPTDFILDGATVSREIVERSAKKLGVKVVEL